MQSPCIKVPREQGENIRQELIKEGILRLDLKIKKNKDFIYFPLTKDIKWKRYPLKREEFKKNIKKNFRTVAQKSMPLEKIPTSFDIIGDIGIIKISDDQKGYSREIGKALLQAHKNLKVILMDDGVQDDYRLRQVTHVMGETRTTTVLREYGMRLYVDIAQVYFSPRLSSERFRIASQIGKGSTVIDMFAGIAPFSILIAKVAKPKMVYAIDINPVAIHYAKINIIENKVDDKITLYQGDAQEILPKLNVRGDHVIMNLPHSAHHFFPEVLPHAKMIHYYEILDKDEIDTHLEMLQGIAKQKGYRIKVGDIRIVGSYSPQKNKIGIDLWVRKDPS